MTNLARDLCGQFVIRAKGLQLKGRRRDDALIDFMLGASVALQLAGLNDDGKHIERLTAMVFAVRGYKECEKLTDQPPTTSIVPNRQPRKEHQS